MLDLRQKSRPWIVLAAGLVLVVQTLAIAWTAGAMAAGPQVDAFGNPLCITSSDHEKTAPADGHSRMFDCCTLGCGAASTMAAAPPDNSVVLQRNLRVSDITFRIDPVARVNTSDHDPHSPRAPPRAV